MSKPRGETPGSLTAIGSNAILQYWILSSVRGKMRVMKRASRRAANL
ncbi:hypothetical protein [Paenibacillus illinoisensis]